MNMILYTLLIIYAFINIDDDIIKVVNNLESIVYLLLVVDIRFILMLSAQLQNRFVIFTNINF